MSQFDVFVQVIQIDFKSIHLKSESVNEHVVISDLFSAAAWNHLILYYVIIQLFTCLCVLDVQSIL